MTSTQQTFEGRPLIRLALSLTVALIVVLGLCPAVALADEMDAEPEGTEEPVLVVQSEEPAAEPEGQPDEDVEVIAQDSSAQTIAVDYLDVDGSVKPAKAEAIPNHHTWGTTGEVTWYVATGNLTIEQNKNNIIVNGDTRLILADNANLTVRGNIITDHLGGRLTIFAQSTNEKSMGELDVIAPQLEPGVLTGFLGQSLTINGGKVSFKGRRTYGIDIIDAKTVTDPQQIFDANMTINGGEVTAVGGIAVHAANGGKSSLTINGGTVIAQGGHDYGIRAWDESNQGNANVTIAGGTVTASAEDDKSAIGTTGGTLTIGDGVSVKAGKNKESAVDVTGKDYSVWGTEKWAQTTVPVTGVTVAPPSETLTVGDTVTLAATVEPKHAVDKSVTWSSSNAGVATVDERTGEVTAVGVGTATVTATANDGSGKSATCAVTVKAKPVPATHKVTVKASPSEGGTATASAAEAAEGVTVTLTATPASGYEFDRWVVDGDGVLKDADSATTELTVGATDVTATANFKKKPTPAKAAKPSTIAHPAAGTIDATWKKVKGAKAYQVQWRVAGAKKWKTKSVKKTSYTITGLRAGKLYDVRVRGVTDAGKGAWSKATRRWFKVVSKVRAKAGKAEGSIKVSWKKNGKATGGYKVFVYARRGGRVVATKVVSKSKASATIKGLKSGRTYYVRVRPYRTKGSTTYVGVLSGYRSAKAK